LCGAEKIAAPAPLSVCEILVNVICGTILLTLLAVVAYGTYQWIEIHIRDCPEHLFWHEPLEDWNRL
jgi:hypothetical protein